MNSWVFFQDSIFSGLNKSERRSNVDFLKSSYLIELYKTKFQMVHPKYKPRNYYLCQT